MKEPTATPSADESLRACFIACDHILEGVVEQMAFCRAAREDGPGDWKEAAQRACDQIEFMALFVGVMQRALTDLRLVIPEERK